MLTPERRAEIENLLQKYDNGYFYNISIDGRAAIRELLTEIDRLNNYITLVDALRAKEKGDT